MIIANLGRLHQRSLNLFEEFLRIFVLFGVKSYYITYNLYCLNFLYIFKFILLMFLYSLNSTINLRQLSY